MHRIRKGLEAWVWVWVSVGGLGCGLFVLPGCVGLDVRPPTPLSSWGRVDAGYSSVLGLL